MNTGGVSEPKHGRARFDTPCYCPFVETGRMKRTNPSSWIPTTPNNAVNNVSGALLTWLTLEWKIYQRISPNALSSHCSCPRILGAPAFPSIQPHVSTVARRTFWPDSTDAMMGDLGCNCCLRGCKIGRGELVHAVWGFGNYDTVDYCY